MARPTVSVDLTALRKNLQEARRRAPSSRLMAVIKANAYGHGLLEVARALSERRNHTEAFDTWRRSSADGFAVARLHEAIALRESGLSQPILVLQGFCDRKELWRFTDYDLWPTLHTEAQCEWLLKDRPPLSGLWLKADTGMHRLGLPPASFRDGYRRLVRLYSEERIVLMTHLACADEPGHPLTERQLELFEHLTADLPSPKSWANSAAILQGLHEGSDWIRPGIMLYGISPFPGKRGGDFGLEPAMTLKSRIVAIRTVGPGEAVGYGASWTSRRKTRLGIVSIGYGDGYPREVPPKTPALIKNRRAPIVGRVAMDLLTLDLTEMPEIGVGEEVCFWGRELPVEEVAAYVGTIPYTLLCGVTQRVEVTYHG